MAPQINSIQMVYSKRLALSVASFFIFVLLHSSAVFARLPSSDLYEKAVSLYERERWDAAKEYFHQYLAEYSETPLYITCLYYLGYCYQRLNDTQKAVSIYHKVLDMASNEDVFWGEMAEKRLQELTPS